MDPNANQTEQRTLAASIIAKLDAAETADLDAIAHDANRLAELVGALAEWRQSGGFSPTDPLSISDARALGAILEAADKGQRVAWLPRYPDTGELTGREAATGTMRAICRDNEGRAFLMDGDSIDVRDGYVWVSSTFEWFFPVRDVIAWAKRGEFVLNYEA